MYFPAKTGPHHKGNTPRTLGYEEKDLSANIRSALTV